MELAVLLGELPMPHPLMDEQSVSDSVTRPTAAIQEAIRMKVPTSWLSPHAKRWWNKELSALKRKKNQLSDASYKFRVVPNHPIHEEHRKVRNQYGNEERPRKPIGLNTWST